MRQALELARLHSADGRHGPFGAVVVRANRMVGRGWNRVVEDTDPTAHAEIMAIRDASRALQTFDLGGCHIYSTCQPCPMCLAAIHWARIDRIFYAATAADAAEHGFDDSRIYRELATPQTERSIPEHQILREEALAVFRDWTNNPPRVPY